MNNISVLYICDQKACPVKLTNKETGLKYCDPCFHTHRTDHAKNPESVKIAQDFLDHFDIDVRSELIEGEKDIKIKYHYILKEKPRTNRGL